MEIKDLRNEIDSIDSQLVSLLEKRMQTATEIAEYKKENKVPIFDSGREREVINKVTAEAAPQLSGYVKTLYQTIFDVSRSYQYSLIGKKSSLCQKIDRVVEETPKNRPDRAVIACQGIEELTHSTPAKRCSLTRALCISTALRMFSRRLKAVFAVTAFCPLKTARQAR